MWTVNNMAKLRKKSAGQSCMLSCYCSTIRGFALPCSKESLDKINEYRQGLNNLYSMKEDISYDPNVYSVYKGLRPVLTETPGLLH